MVYSNVPSLLLSYVVLGIISTTDISATLGRSAGRPTPLGLPKFMRNPLYARHPILHRIVLYVLVVVASIQISDFTISGRLVTISLCNDA